MAFRFFVFIAVLLAASSAAFSSDIKFVTHDIEGFSYIDQHGELRGLKHTGRRAYNIELVREMRIKMGHANRHYYVMPFNRAINLILDNKAPYAMFNTGRKPSREGRMKWVGPMTNDKISAYKLKSNLTAVKTLEEAKKLSICIGDGGNQDDFLTKNNFKSIVRSVSQTTCFKMLSLKRIDLAVSSEYDLIGHLKNAGISTNLIEKAGFPL